MLGGGVVLLGLSALTGEFSRLEWAAVSARALGAWVYVTVLGSVAYGSYLWLLKASTPAKAATYAYVNPVIALLLGYLLGDEVLSAWTMGCSAAVGRRCQGRLPSGRESHRAVEVQPDRRPAGH